MASGPGRAGEVAALGVPASAASARALCLSLAAAVGATGPVLSALATHDDVRGLPGHVAFSTGLSVVNESCATALVALPGLVQLVVLWWLLTAFIDMARARRDAGEPDMSSAWAVFGALVPGYGAFHLIGIARLLDAGSDPRQYPPAPDPSLPDAVGYRDAAPTARDHAPSLPRGLVWLWGISMGVTSTALLVSSASAVVVLSRPGALLVVFAYIAAALSTLLALRFSVRIDELFVRARHERGERPVPAPRANPSPLAWGLAAHLGLVVGAHVALSPIIDFSSNALLVAVRLCVVVAAVLGALAWAGRPRSRGVGLVLLALTAALDLAGLALVSVRGHAQVSAEARRVVPAMILASDLQALVSTIELGAPERLIERVARLQVHLERAADEADSPYAQALRCEGVFGAQAFAAQLAAFSQGEPLLDETEEALAERLGRIDLALEKNSERAVDAMAVCMASHGVSRRGIGEFSRRPRSIGDVALLAALGDHTRSLLALRRAERGGGEGEIERARRAEILVRRDLGVSLRASPISLGSRVIGVSTASERLVLYRGGPLFGGSSGLSAVRYEGPHGSLQAYASPQPAAGARPIVVLWAASDDVATDLEAAAGLSSDRVWVFVATTRGQPGNPPAAADGAAVDDLRAARAHVISMDHVERRRLLVVGYREGASKALLLAGAGASAIGYVLARPLFVGRSREAGAFGLARPSLPETLTSQLASPVWLLSGSAEIIEAGAYVARANESGKVAGAHACPEHGCDAATLSRLVARLIETDGSGWPDAAPFAVSQNEVDIARAQRAGR